MNYGYKFGTISKETYDEFKNKMGRIEKEKENLRENKIKNDSLYKYIKRPEISYKALIKNNLHSCNLNDDEIHILETEIKYEGYILQQQSEAKKFEKLEKKKIPETIDYDAVKGIGREAKEKLKKIKPESIGQASRIPGISSCDLSLLAVYLRKKAKDLQ